MKFKLKKNFLLILLVFIKMGPLLLSQQTEKYRSNIKAIENYIKKQIKIDRITGISFGFMKNDFVWKKGFGYADLENRIPTTAKSAYRLASITKTMTAVAVLHLMEKGKIDLDAEVQTYVPYFPRKKWPITIRQLLGHLGGITHYRDYDVEGHIKVHKDTREALAIFQNFDLVAEPGTTFHYTSYGFNLLGAVIEGAAKKSYGAYLKKNIWTPLGMNNTNMESPDELLPGRVRGYRLINGEIKNSEYVDISSRFAGGGTRSTVIDLLNFAKGIIQGNVISKETVNKMFTSLVTTDGYFTGYGMGWSITPINGRFCVGHRGSQAETRTALFVFPRENFAVSVACNLEGSNPSKYAIRIYELIFGEIWDYWSRSIPIYTGVETNHHILSAMQAVFNHGTSYYQQHQKSHTTEKKELAAAFTFFNKTVHPETLRSHRKETLKKIKDARHPKGGEMFIKIGSHMARNLMKEYGEDRFNSYHKYGCIKFFNDYTKISSNKTNYNTDLRFSEQFQQMIDQWNKQWEKTGKQIHNTTITPYSNLNHLEKRLKSNFKGATLYPDFIRPISDVVRYFCIQNNKKEAIKWSNLCAELYPESAHSFVILGHTHLYFGNNKKANEFFKKASKSPIHKGIYGPRTFISMANFLWDFGGQINKAVEFIKTGLDLFPESDRLNFYMGAAYVERAKMYLKKTLSLDPHHKWAWKMLKKIE